MTDLRADLLARIDRALAICEAATAPPWWQDQGAWKVHHGPGCDRIITANTPDEPGGGTGTTNAAFVCFARTAYPALLRATREEVERHAGEGHSLYIWCRFCRDSYGAAVEWPCRYLRDLAAALGEKGK
jgi:hypothetical protein